MHFSFKEHYLLQIFLLNIRQDSARKKYDHIWEGLDPSKYNCKLNSLDQVPTFPYLLTGLTL